MLSNAINPSSSSNSVNTNVEQLDYRNVDLWPKFESEKLKVSLNLPLDYQLAKESDSSYEFDGSGPTEHRPIFLVTKNITDFDSIKLCTESTLQAPCIVPSYFDKTIPEEQEVFVGDVPARKFYVWRYVGRIEIVAQTLKEPYIEVRSVITDTELFEAILSTFQFTN